MVKVSVIVPVYNTKNYIHRLLTSLENQTYRNFEVIFVDDHSNDGTYGILKDFRDKNPDWVHIERTPRPRSGPSLGRNIGLDISSGKYIAFIDSDDWWSEDFLERTVENIKGHDGVYTGYCDIINGKNLCIRPRVVGSTDWEPILRMKARFGIGNTLLRAALIEDYRIRFPEGIRVSEDSYFFLAYLSVIKKPLFGLEGCAFYHRVRASSLSQTSLSLQEGVDKIEQTLESYMRLKDFIFQNSCCPEKFWSLVERGLLPRSILTYITSISDSTGREYGRKLVRTYWKYLREFRPTFNYMSFLTLLWLIDPFVPVRSLLKRLAIH